MKIDDASLGVQAFHALALGQCQPRSFALLLSKWSPRGHAMSDGKELSALIDLIYEAVLDNDLWPSVLIKLADTIGAAHASMPSVDWRANIFTPLAPRDDPE